MMIDTHKNTHDISYLFLRFVVSNNTSLSDSYVVILLVLQENICELPFIIQVYSI